MRLTLVLVVTGVWVLGCGLVRVPVFSEGDEGFTKFERPQAHKECKEDDECSTNGCGNHCTATSTGDFIANCEEAPHKAHSTCGCVRNRCQWYYNDGALSPQ